MIKYWYKLFVAVWSNGNTIKLSWIKGKQNILVWIAPWDIII
jgi:hypothetical protein